MQSRTVWNVAHYNLTAMAKLYADYWGPSPGRVDLLLLPTTLVYGGYEPYYLFNSRDLHEKLTTKFMHLNIHLF